MTSQAIYRLHCDAPNCTATGVVENITDSPDGWTRLRSDAHLDGWKPGTFKLLNGRTRPDKRDLWDVTAGKFVLHLCADHRDAFAEHRPSTVGTAASKSGARHITVKCSCGTPIPWVNDMHVVGSRSQGPQRTPEAAWWRHLPAELQGYATRDLTENA